MMARYCVKDGPFASIFEKQTKGKARRNKNSRERDTQHTAHSKQQTEMKKPRVETLKHSAGGTVDFQAAEITAHNTPNSNYLISVQKEPHYCFFQKKIGNSEESTTPRTPGHRISHFSAKEGNLSTSWLFLFSDRVFLIYSVKFY